ncbi:MAG: hypothetical protein MZV65_31355 [Chromatiales bacterium]|nr:hypothetical protein [Chromatiales bacterium]
MCLELPREVDRAAHWHSRPARRERTSPAPPATTATSAQGRGARRGARRPRSATPATSPSAASSRSAYAHPVRQGKLACSDCHAPHGTHGRRSSWCKATLNQTCYELPRRQARPVPVGARAGRRGLLDLPRAARLARSPACSRRAARCCASPCHSQQGHPSVAYGPSGLPGGGAPPVDARARQLHELPLAGARIEPSLGLDADAVSRHGTPQPHNLRARGRHASSLARRASRRCDGRNRVGASAPTPASLDLQQVPVRRGYTSEARSSARLRRRDSAQVRRLHRPRRRRAATSIANAEGRAAHESGYVLDYELLDLGLDSRAAARRGRQAGRATSSALFYDRIPHRIWDTTRRPSSAASAAPT